MLNYQGRLCVPKVDGLQETVMEETHRYRYSIHLGSTKMYCELNEVYWWEDMKKDIIQFVGKCSNYHKVKVQHQKHEGLAQYD